MSKLYRYTSGVHADQGSTPWDTARTGVTIESIPTTRVEQYDALADALYNAGYTRYDRQLAGASGTTNTTRDDVWFSEGEGSDKHILIRTVLSDSGSSGSRYLWVTIAPKRDDSATATLSQGTWDGTTTVLFGDTSQFRARSGSLPGSFVRLNSDGQWFEVTAINGGVDVTIDAAGFTIPNSGGAADSSVLTPVLEREIGTQAFVNIAPFSVTDHRFDLSAGDFNADFQILVDLDHFWFVLQNVNHTSTMFVMNVGDLRPFDMNPNTMVLGAAVTNGDFVELLTEDGAGSSVDPRVLGFRPLDRIQIVNVDPNGVVRAETQVIVRTQIDRIVTRRLRFDYDGDDDTVNPRVYGARIGMMPVPIEKRLGANEEIEVTAASTNIRTPFFQKDLVDRPGQLGGTDGDFLEPSTSGGGEVGYDVHYAQLSTHAQTNDEYGSGTTGNDRTLRLTLRSVAIGYLPSAGKAGSIFGKVPFLHSYNGDVNYYTHDNHLRDRVTPNEDYVPFRFTATSARNYTMGPTPGP